jgi:hypothetical protein
VIISQEERAYQLIATPLPKIEQTFTVTDNLTGQQLEYLYLWKRPELRPVWEKAFANELGRLAQGIRDIEGTDTIELITAAQVPRARKITYGRLVCNIRPQKKETHRVQLIMGGDRIDYPGETATKNANLTTSKCLWNSTISTEGDQFMCADVKNFYLNTILNRPEYMKLALSLISQEIIETYRLAEKAKNSQVYIKINSGMSGLPQAGRLANDLLVKRLAPHGYFPVRHTHGLWKHDTRPVTFTLVVDNFGIKYVGKEHVDHLLQALKQEYEVTEDWTGALYCGITLDWNYKEGTVDLSMPVYVDAALHKFQHKPPTRPEHAPYPARAKQDGAKVHITPEQDTSAALSADGRKRIQRVVGSLLYYGRAVDPTMLTATSAIASQQATATDDTNLKLLHLLNYAASHPDASIRYSAS